MPGPVVVVGGSAGALEALRSLVACLPRDLPAPVLVVIHIPATGNSRLAEVLTRAGPLPAAPAGHLDALVPGRILVAPPDHHLLVQDGAVVLGTGPKENRHRPAIDALFRTAARWHGPRVVGVVLSGALDDGAVGAAAIAAQDGRVVVQDPEDALVSAMPRAALLAVRRAMVAPAAELGDLVSRLVHRPPPVAGGTARQPSEASMDKAEGAIEYPEAGRPMALGCPECQGGMFEHVAGGVPQYLCHVGHSWSPQTLLEAQRHAVEASLWNAASKLLEVAALHQRLAEAGEGAASTGAHREAHRRAAAHARAKAAEVGEFISHAVPDALDDAVSTPLPPAAVEGR